MLKGYQSSLINFCRGENFISEGFISFYKKECTGLMKKGIHSRIHDVL